MIGEIIPSRESTTNRSRSRFLGYWLNNQIADIPRIKPTSAFGLVQRARPPHKPVSTANIAEWRQIVDRAEKNAASIAPEVKMPIKEPGVANIPEFGPI